jgi:hypothetical protein
MDPFGFALEQFDATGRWRTEDGGNPIVADSVMYDGTLVTGPSDLREWLLTYDDQFVRNVAENMLTYALGRGVEYYDMPVVRHIVREAEKDDYRFSALVLAVINSEPFRMNQKADAVSVALASD